MHFQVIFLVVIAIYCFEQSNSSEVNDKCKLPSERSNLNGKYRKKIRNFNIAPKRKLGEKIARTRGRLSNQIKTAAQKYKRYCRKPDFSSTYNGFILSNFKNTTVCPGQWDRIDIPSYYVDEKNWICVTLGNFQRFKCPTYNCLSSRCQLGSDAPDPKAHPRVVYSCQLDSFVDVPFYVFCFHQKDATKFEFRKEFMILSRCCRCTKYTCTE